MESKTKISTRNLNLYYGENHALKNINLDLYEHKITAFIGPSGCGKSTYLKTLNRMNDLVPGVKIDVQMFQHHFSATSAITETGS